MGEPEHVGEGEHWPTSQGFSFSSRRCGPMGSGSICQRCNVPEGLWLVLQYEALENESVQGLATHASFRSDTTEVTGF